MDTINTIQSYFDNVIIDNTNHLQILTQLNKNNALRSELGHRCCCYCFRHDCLCNVDCMVQWVYKSEEILGLLANKTVPKTLNQDPGADMGLNLF